MNRLILNSLMESQVDPEVKELARKVMGTYVNPSWRSTLRNAPLVGGIARKLIRNPSHEERTKAAKKVFDDAMEKHPVYRRGKAAAKSYGITESSYRPVIDAALDSLFPDPGPPVSSTKKWGKRALKLGAAGAALYGVSRYAGRGPKTFAADAPPTPQPLVPKEPKATPKNSTRTEVKVKFQ